MKRYINCGVALLSVTAALISTSCSKDEAYESSVTRDLQMTLDGEPWNIYYGTANKPLFIYSADGAYLHNYSTSYRFSLEEGQYRVLATTQADYLTPPTSLNDQIIEQDPETRRTFAISDPVTYNAGDPMSLHLKTRTGLLRLRATDVKSDKSYSSIRTTLTTPVTAYHVGQAAVVLGDPYELTRTKETTGGGVGFTEDAVLLGADVPLEVRLDYLDAAGQVVKSRTLQGDEAIKVAPNDTTVVEFMLNNPDELVTIDYNIVIGPTRWNESTLFPSTEVRVPDGYTYVAPGESIDEVIKAQTADPSVDEIRVFLKAGAAYKIGGTTTNTISKSISILGQTPGYGQSETVVTLNSYTINGNVDRIHFENIEFKGLANRFFYLNNNAKCEVREISMVNCRFPAKWNQGQIWHQTSANAIVHNFRMKGCSVINIVGAKSNAMFNLPSTKVSSVYNWEFSDCLFHGNFGSNIFFMKGLEKANAPVNIKFDNCRFLDTKGDAFTLCEIKPATAAVTVNIEGCLVGSSKSGMATWMTTGANVTVNASGNTRAKGYSMKAYGFTPEPEESSMTFDEIISSLNL